MTAPVDTAPPAGVAGTGAAAAGGLTAAEATAYLALVQAQAAVRAALTQAAIDAVLAPLQGFDGWFDSAEITRLVTTIVRRILPVQTQAARVTDAYIARTLTRLRGRPVRPVGAVDVRELRRRLPANVIEDLARGRRQPPIVDIGDTDDGPTEQVHDPVEELVSEQDTEWVRPQDVYGRLADTYRWQRIAHDATHEQALQKVLARGEAVARTEISLAVRKQERHTMRRLGVTHYRRVLHPELSQTGLSCGLCIVAADRIYTTERLKEIHDNCNCETLAIEGGKDPGIRLNRDDLESLYFAAGGGERRETGIGKPGKAALKKLRVAVTEHGELGPILVNRNGKFRDAAAYAKTQSVDPRLRAQAQLDSMVESLARWEAKKAAGETQKTTGVDIDAAIKFHRQKIAELRRIAA